MSDGLPDPRCQLRPLCFVLASKAIFAALPKRILTFQCLLSRISFSMGVQCQLLDHLDSLKLVGVVATEEQLHVSLIGRADGPDGAFAFRIVSRKVFAVFVKVGDHVAVQDKCAYLSIQMINDDVALSLLDLLLEV